MRGILQLSSALASLVTIRRDAANANASPSAPQGQGTSSSGGAEAGFVLPAPLQAVEQVSGVNKLFDVGRRSVCLHSKIEGR